MYRILVPTYDILFFLSHSSSTQYLALLAGLMGYTYPTAPANPTETMRVAN